MIVIANNIAFNDGQLCCNLPIGDISASGAER